MKRILVEELFQMTMGRDVNAEKLKDVSGVGMLPYLSARSIESKKANSFVDENDGLIVERDDLILVFEGKQAGRVVTEQKGTIARSLMRLRIKKSWKKRTSLYFIRVSC